MRLRRHNEAPPGGIRFVDKASGFRVHAWSLQSAGAQWYQEQLRRGVRTTLERAKDEVEQFTCNELMRDAGWENFVEITSEWRAEDYLGLDTFERETSSPSSKDQLFAVVFPFCAKDGVGALKLMRWITELTPKTEHILVLSHDHNTPPTFAEKIREEALKVFGVIKECVYPNPGLDQWPPTVAFKAAAFYMQKVGLPWLWMEYDMVPLRGDWLDRLQEVYWKCGKAFAGPIVPQMEHCNGTAIYPANTPKRIPRALSLMRTAWDVTMKAEMIGDCHNLHPLLYHAWTMVDGKFHPYAGGAPPEFPRGSKLIEQIPKESVVFHRCKGGSLIDRLRERRLVSV